MRALLYYNQRDIKLTDVAMPVPQEDEVLIKVTDAGLCQTQVNEFIEGPYIINMKPHRITKKSIPLIVGHEFGGIIESVGDMQNNSSMIGAQAAVLPLASCGQCANCKAGLDNACSDVIYYGLIGENGGFAEYACVKKENVFFTKNRDLLTFVEPILVAIHGARKIQNGIRNKKVCVLGAGGVGISVAAVFRDYFGGNVVISDVLPGRLERVKRAGFQVVEKDSLYRDYDVVADCAGNDPTSRLSAFTEGFEYLKKNGTLIGIGTYFHPVSVVPAAIMLNENRIVTSFLYSHEDVSLLEDVISSIKVNFSDLITRVSLENVIEDGYYRSEVDKDSFTRLVVVP
jgi:Threonine dehydrogenase and related Zn-dependent dehydrogenases